MTNERTTKPMENNNRRLERALISGVTPRRTRLYT
jgi:hypothetical protein